MMQKISAEVFNERILQAIELKDKNELDIAKTLFLELLKLEPKNSALLYSLGALESAKGNFESANNYIDQHLAVSPNFALGHLAKSVILFNARNFESSLQSVQKALSINPIMQEAQLHLSNVETAIKIQTQNKILILHTISELNIKAIELQKNEHIDLAIEAFEKTLSLDENNFVALYSLGVIEVKKVNNEKALEYFNRSIKSHPSEPKSYHAKGIVLAELERYEEALDCYHAGLSVAPATPEIYLNIAQLLQFLKRHKEAILILQKATKIIPNHIPFLESQGKLLIQYKEFKLASKLYEEIIKIEPCNKNAQPQLMLCRTHDCDWHDYDIIKTKILNGIKDRTIVCAPLTFMSISAELPLVKDSTQGYVEGKFKFDRPPLWKGEIYLHAKKRIAFISADFRIHPVGSLFIGILENADKLQFELFGFFIGNNDQSELWTRYKNAFDQSYDCQTKSNHEIARIIYELKIDILIDLSGHTEGERLDVFSRRPAPIQITYLGFPGTLCLPFIDYLIADPITIPIEHKQYFNEKILYLDQCYLPRDKSKQFNRKSRSKKNYGLPEKGFIFCNFNHNFKITPDILAYWMQLLINVPDSVLWLMQLNQQAKINIIKTVESQNIDSNRIIFASRLPDIEDHLARYQQADLFLDTYPYNGHTTVGDALASGLPVVTLRGASFASRVASSLLHDVQMIENICDSEEEYYKRALYLAQNPEEINQLKIHLGTLLKLSWPRENKEQSFNFFEILRKL